MMNYFCNDRANVSELIGKVLKAVTMNEDKNEIHFETEDMIYIMCHIQDCCEGVGIEEIVGDLQDLVGTPILLAEDVSNEAPEESSSTDPWPESFTWTFYRFRTVKGNVDIRWYGGSNGYYSEGVDFVKEPRKAA